MASLRSISLLLVLLLNGCAAPAAQALRIRVLSSEAPKAPPAERSHAESPSEQQPLPAPRIGAPGGSGAGSRRVTPATVF